MLLAISLLVVIIKTGINNVWFLDLCSFSLWHSSHTHQITAIKRRHQSLTRPHHKMPGLFYPVVVVIAVSVTTAFADTPSGYDPILFCKL